MDKQAIKEICLKHGYKLKPQADGTQDLNAYVYDAFDEVLSRVRRGQQMVNLDKSAALSDALHLIQSGVRYNSEKDLERGLELLRYTRDELCASPKYHDDIELVGILGRLNDGESFADNMPDSNDPINPNHYKTNSGVECIEVAELFPYSLGNAVKYAWRAGKKDNLKQDLGKCEWYLNRAMTNGEIVFLKPPTQATHKAWQKFKRVVNELPRRNAAVLDNILQGDLQAALNVLDSWLAEED